MNRKAVFFDIDGTLKPMRKDIPEHTKRAVRQLIDNGHLVFISTGRTKASAKTLNSIEALDIPGFIMGAGCHVEYGEETIFEQNLPADQLAKIMGILDSCEAFYAMEGSRYLYYQKHNEKKFKDMMEKGFGSIPLIEYEGEADDAQKITVFHVDPDRIRPYLGELSRIMTIITYENEPDVLELIPRGISKATGIQAVMNHFQIPWEDTFAFGDGPNDLEMLKFVKYGIAMENSEQCALEAAPYCTGPSDGDGIAQGLRRFGLID